MPAFTEKARLAGMKARKRNALLRKKGLLPPIKRRNQAAATSIPLDAIPMPEKRKYTKAVKKAGASDVGLRVLALLERLL